MTVVNPKSISGINSITTGSGSDNLLTIHTSDANNTERVRVNSSGDVIVGSGVTLSPDGDIFATGVTTSTTFVGNLTGNVTGNISGGTVAGSTGTFTSHVSLGDSDQLRFGDSNDLVIQHNGTDSLISDTGTGDLYIRGSDDIFIQKGDGSETFISCKDDGAVKLYHNNTLRLETRTSDVKFYDGLVAIDNAQIQLGSSGDLKLYHDGTNSYVDNSVGGILRVRGHSSSQVEIQPKGGQYGVTLIPDGAVELYHNGTKQCETSANGLAFPAGKGIDFSAQTHGTAASGVTVNSELLDHYEEGTFSPLLKRLMTNGSTETNFYDQGTKQGYYQIIGNRIWITARIHWSGGSTGTGSLILTNLPYTPTSGGANEVPMYIGFRSGFNYTNIAGYLVQSMNRFMVQYYDANGSYAIAPSATDSSGHFYFAMNYQI